MRAQNLLETPPPNWRCGAILKDCAFLNDSNDYGHSKSVHLPLRHALIISEPGRYERAAREAYWAGFLPKMVRSIKRKRNRCYPKGNWSNVTEQSEIKLVNMLEAHKLALEYIAQANVPHAIFEDDIVLATSRTEVQGWLNTPSSTKRLGHNSTFLRHNFDFVPLGSCGVHFNHGCGHAYWYTPDGARAALAFWKPALASCRKENYIYDLTLYVNRKYRRTSGLACSTRCAPDRNLVPVCVDEEAKRVVSHRRTCLDGSVATHPCAKGEALRCIDWHELKSYESEQRKRFSPNRYRGYGHFLQDFIGVTPTHTAGPMGKARAVMILDDDAAWDG